VARPCSCHTAAAMTPPTRKACIHSGLGTKRADGPSAERRTMLACLGRLCVWRGRLRRLRPERRVGRFWGPHGYRWGAAERAAGLRDPARPPAMRLMWRSGKQAPDTFKWPQESGAQCGIGVRSGNGVTARCVAARRDGDTCSIASRVRSPNETILWRTGDFCRVFCRLPRPESSPAVAIRSVSSSVGLHRRVSGRSFCCCESHF
jgi:hypothetical protein